MKGKFNHPEGYITELPELDGPERSNYEAEQTELYFDHVAIYKDHIASLRSFTISGNWKAKTGEVVEFEYGYQMKSLEDENRDWVDCTKNQYGHRGTMSRRIVAIPVPDSQPDDLLDYHGINYGGPKEDNQQSEDPLSKLPERPPFKEFIKFLEGDSKFYVDEVRYWSKLMMNEEISFSRFVELLNEKLFKLTESVQPPHTGEREAISGEVK